MSHFRIFVVFSVFAVVCWGWSAQAATFFFETQNAGVAQSEFFIAHLFLNTQGQEINAISGTVTIPPDCSLQRIARDNSVFPLWIQEELTDDGQLSFSAMVPGGYLGERGLVWSLSCAVKRQQPWDITLVSAQALINDGQGTEAALAALPVRARFIPEAFPGTAPEVIEDTLPPEPFTPIVTRDASAWGNQWVALFETKDKGSGMNHYEVAESRSRLARSHEWHIAQSPYTLRDQTRASFLFVKAVDNAGNGRIAVVAPQGILGYARRYSIMLIGLGAIVFTTWYYVRRFRKP